MKELTPLPGDRIEVACARLAEAAPAVMTFNGTRIEAMPGDTAKVLYEAWCLTRANRTAEKPAEPFALEHWRRRAEVAEKQLAAAKSALAATRFALHQSEAKGAPLETATVRQALKVHDSVYWTEQHARDAVADFLLGDDDNG